MPPITGALNGLYGIEPHLPPLTFFVNDMPPGYTPDVVELYTSAYDYVLGETAIDVGAKGSSEVTVGGSGGNFTFTINPASSYHPIYEAVFGEAPRH